MDRRIVRLMKDLALEHVAGRIGDASYLEQMARLRPSQAREPGARSRPRSTRRKPSPFIEGIAATRELATPEERARLVQATYERITVKGPSVVRARLTPMAERTGLPALLPASVPTEWAVARPPSVGRTDAGSIRIPVDGARRGQVI